MKFNHNEILTFIAVNIFRLSYSLTLTEYRLQQLDSVFWPPCRIVTKFMTCVLHLLSLGQWSRDWLLTWL